MVFSGGDNIIGFIGAGKAGCSLARYFARRGFEISGFWSRSFKETGFDFLQSPNDVASKSEIIFITVTDSAISAVWNGLDKSALKNKTICHCSGSLTSDIFTRADRNTVCSVHPMLAFNSGRTSTEKISRAFFTIEGGRAAVEKISALLTRCGNPFRVIDAQSKPKYHAAACFASNFVTAVCAEAFELLEECGFSEDEAKAALSPLMAENMENIISCGIRGSLTGPAARGDALTVKKHLNALGEEKKRAYKPLCAIMARLAGHEELLEELT